MAATDSTVPQQRGLTPWKPGQSGNPKGRPKGSRNKLGEQFIQDLYVKWMKSGVSALDRMCKDDPSGFVRLVAGILPKDLHIKENPLEHWTDDEIDEALEAIRAACAADARKA